MTTKRQNGFYISTENNVIVEIHNIETGAIFSLGDEVTKYSSSFIIKEFTIQKASLYSMPWAHSDKGNEERFSVWGKHQIVKELTKL